MKGHFLPTSLPTCVLVPSFGLQGMVWGKLLFFLILILAVLGLHCCVQAFSSCAEWGLLPSWVGLSLQWLLLLWSTDSRVCGLQLLLIVCAWA